MSGIKFPFVFLLLVCFTSSKGQQLFVSVDVAKKLKVKSAVEKVFFGGSNTSGMTYTEFYDTTGKATEQLWYNDYLNTLSAKEFFFYNEKGQLIMIKGDHNDGDSSREIFSYNSKGFLDKNFAGKINYKYNSQGQVIEKTEKTAKPSDLVTKYIYDSLNRLTVTDEYFGNILQSKDSLFYNEKGQKCREILSYYTLYVKGNSLDAQYETTFTYNEIGLVVTEKIIQTIVSPLEKKADNRICTYEYTFYQ